jgi:polysaccharide biosynthesis protein PslH
MRILYLCHRFPFPPKRGGKIRPFNMIRHLAKSHEVHVASLVHDDDDERDAAGIEPYCSSFVFDRPSSFGKWASMVGRLPSSSPSAMGYFYSRRLQNAIDQLLAEKKFDFAFVHCAFVAPYLVGKKNLPRVLDFGDMDSQKWLAYSQVKPFPLNVGFGLEGRKMWETEKRLAADFDLCTATTQLEHETLQSLGTARATDWFPNGVDFSYFDKPSADYDSNKIVLLGRMDYFPNQQATERFAKRIFPLVKKHNPKAEFLVVGANPSQAVKNLAKIEGITVTGTVPDVREYVSGAALTVAPLEIARGVQNKILESLAMEVPVVATATAAKGVDAIPGKHLLVADDDQIFADQVIRIMDSKALRRELGEAGRLRVIDRHSWATSLSRLDAIVERVVPSVKRG